MPEGLIRPVPRFNSARSLLANNHFQLGYVTNDLDAAMAVFAARFGVSQFRENDADLPCGGRVCTRTVWIGAMMYEIAMGHGEGMEVFSEAAPQGGPFVLKFHHFGYLVPDDASWAALERAIAASGLRVRKPSDIPGYVRTCFVAVPEIDHLLE